MSLHTAAQILIALPMVAIGIGLLFFRDSLDDRPRQDEIDEFNEFQASLRKARR